MEIEVKSVDSTGSGYCVVFNDDGTSFGQMFQNLPTDTEENFMEALRDLVETRAVAQKVKAFNPTIPFLVGIKRPLPARKQPQAIPAP